jgi:hypothetical protein
LEIAFRYRASFYQAFRKQFAFRALFVLFPLILLLRFVGLLIGLISGAGKEAGDRFLGFELFKVSLVFWNENDL